MADGIVDEQGYALLTGDDFPAYISDLEKGAEGTDVRRLQTRLTTLYYLTDGIDGIFGSNTQSAVKYFQKHNDLEQTGIADEQTQLKLYSSDAVPTAKPTLQPASRDSKGNGKSYSKYKLVIDVSDQRVYAYGYENGAYGPLARVYGVFHRHQVRSYAAGHVHLDRTAGQVVLLHQVQVLGSVCIPHNRPVLLPLGAL